LINRLDGELHRWNRRLLPESLRVQLVHRHADPHVGAFGQLRVGLRVHDRAGPEMIAAHFGRRLRFRHAHVGVADDRQLIAEGLERTQAALADVETTPRGGRNPQILGQTVLADAGRAMHLLDADETCAPGGPRRRRLGEHGSCRNHRVEKRQRHGGADATQNGAPRQVLLGHKHRRCPLLVVCQLLRSVVRDFRQRRSKRRAFHHAEDQ
jgi:hypothetical protein